MAIDATAPRTRRALLAAGFGGVVSTVASAILRPAPTRAGTDGDVIAGGYNQTFGVTEIDVQGNIQGLHVYSSSQAAVVGEAQTTGIGVGGGADSGAGVQGTSNSGHGVEGYTDTGAAGTYGHSYTTVGVLGESDSDIGVKGASNTGIGIYGNSGASGHPGALGWNEGGGAGVLGYSGTGNVPAAGPNTGVFGYAAQDGTARGVHGKTTVGEGVRGQATSGVGVYAAASDTGFALQTSGRTKLDRSGQASVAPGATTVDVTVPGGLAGKPLPFATLLRYHPGVYIAAIRPNYPTAGVMRIYLSQSASATVSTPLSWFVLG